MVSKGGSGEIKENVIPQRKKLGIKGKLHMHLDIKVVSNASTYIKGISS